MRTYRFYFYDDHIVGRFDFPADHDDGAVEIAEILFDACSDRCRSWEIWDRNVFLARGPRTLGPQPRLSDLTDQKQDNIIQCEDAMLNSEWPIASSKRLLAELKKASNDRQSRNTTLAEARSARSPLSDSMRSP